ncbi:unnamed protein product [Phytophthora fragariaefolia]|uniref:Unnamed protein product n=1 Tax=Phytophthora fragariaefolia TaxID=1490495 RepID=A0A9W7CZ21_9STRA|nr:unnamed protein product [Phytophthora fragariaefolia]
MAKLQTSTRPTRKSSRLEAASENNDDIDQPSTNENDEEGDERGHGGHEDPALYRSVETDTVAAPFDVSPAARVPAIGDDGSDDNAGNNDVDEVHHSEGDNTESECEENPPANGDTPNHMTATMATMAVALQQLTTMVGNLQPPTHTRATTQGNDEERRGRRLDLTTRTEDVRRSREQRRRRRSPSPGGSSSSSSRSEESSSGESEASRSDESDESSESDEQDDVRCDSRRRRRDGRPRRKNVKDLDLPTFTPSPDMPVSTWIDRVDLALKGAELSGHGKWSDHELYFILGNKLLENAASWWVDINRGMPERDKTWKKLKKALLRRYGENSTSQQPSGE